MSELENKLDEIAGGVINKTESQETNNETEIKTETKEVETVEEETTEEIKTETKEVEITKEEVKEDFTEDLIKNAIGEKNITEVPAEAEDSFVSDTFNEFLNNASKINEVDNAKKDVAPVDDEKLNKPTKNTILENIKVDLNNIEIVKPTDVFTAKALEKTILDDSSSMLVTCCQSSYTAELTALKSQEIQTLSNSDVDYYSYKKKLYQLVHKHIVTTSVGPINYNDWLHKTSYFDMETLLYGIYCQTFNYQNKYEIRCSNPRCRHNYDAIVNNNTLIELRGSEKETFSKIKEIISNIKNADELLDNSLVHTTKRVILEESKIIIDINIPSLFDYLENVVAKTDDSELEEYQNAVGLSLFVKGIYLPNILEYEKTGKLNWVELDLKDNEGMNLAPASNKLIETISNLSYYDSLQLSDEINTFVEKYRISYSIKNVTCPRCGNVIPRITLDMEEVLFDTIRQGRNGK